MAATVKSFLGSSFVISTRDDCINILITLIFPRKEAPVAGDSRYLRPSTAVQAANSLIRAVPCAWARDSALKGKNPRVKGFRERGEVKQGGTVWQDQSSTRGEASGICQAPRGPLSPPGLVPKLELLGGDSETSPDVFDLCHKVTVALQ